MNRHLKLSRPRTTRGPSEPAVSFSLRLLTWYDEQLRRGWDFKELPKFNQVELSCLEECWQQIGRILDYHELIEKGIGDGGFFDPLIPSVVSPPAGEAKKGGTA